MYHYCAFEMHKAKDEIEVIKFEIMTLRSMSASARPEIAEAAGSRMLKLQEELDLLEGRDNFKRAGKGAAPSLRLLKPDSHS